MLECANHVQHRQDSTGYNRDYWNPWCECRRTGFGRLKTTDGETILYSSQVDELNRSGVALILGGMESACLEKWTPVNNRIITARFHLRYIKTTVVQVYAPTNELDDEVKEAF